MKQLCLIPGDGIGQEVVPVAVRILERLLPGLQIIEAEAGWDCFQRHGQSVPERTLQAMRECGAGLFGAVSSPSQRVEGYRSAILSLRQGLLLNVNLRPVRSWPQISPRADVDLLILRENSEDLYIGREHMQSADVAIAERLISRQASEHIAQRAAEVAGLRASRRITVVHKANVLPLSCGLFRDSCRQVLASAGLDYIVDERLVDVAALHLVERPQDFDLLVTTNLFGDILSDLASYWSGGLGMAPSLNWGQDIALAEPVHGSAPDIAGSGKANPLAAILSCALLLRYHWQASALADQLEDAVECLLGEVPIAELGAQTTRTLEQELLKRLERFARI